MRQEYKELLIREDFIGLEKAGKNLINSNSKSAMGYYLLFLADVRDYSNFNYTGENQYYEKAITYANRRENNEFESEFQVYSSLNNKGYRSLLRYAQLGDIAGFKRILKVINDSVDYLYLPDFYESFEYILESLEDEMAIDLSILACNFLYIKTTNIIFSDMLILLTKMSEENNTKLGRYNNCFSKEEILFILNNIENNKPIYNAKSILLEKPRVDFIIEETPENTFDVNNKLADLKMINYFLFPSYINNKPTIIASFDDDEALNDFERYLFDYKYMKINNLYDKESYKNFGYGIVLIDSNEYEKEIAKYLNREFGYNYYDALAIVKKTPGLILNGRPYDEILDAINFLDSYECKYLLISCNAPMIKGKYGVVLTTPDKKSSLKYELTNIIYSQNDSLLNEAPVLLNAAVSLEEAQDLVAFLNKYSLNGEIIKFDDILKIRGNVYLYLYDAGNNIDEVYEVIKRVCNLGKRTRMLVEKGNCYLSKGNICCNFNDVANTLTNLGAVISCEKKSYFDKYLDLYKEGYEVLLCWPGDNFDIVCDILEDNSLLNSKEIARIKENCPCVVQRFNSYMEANDYGQKLIDSGAKVKLMGPSNYKETSIEFCNVEIKQKGILNDSSYDIIKGLGQFKGVSEVEIRKRLNNMRDILIENVTYNTATRIKTRLLAAFYDVEIIPVKANNRICQYYNYKNQDYSITLIEAGDKVKTISAIRDVLPLSLLEAKRLVDKAPVEILLNLLIEEANDYYNFFTEKGVNVKITSSNNNEEVDNNEEVKQKSEITITLQGPGHNKLTTIKIVKELLNFTLIDAKRLVEAAPIVLKKYENVDEANDDYEMLKALGLSVRISGNEVEDDKYQIILNSYGNKRLACIRYVSEVLKISLTEASNLIEGAPKVIYESTDKADVDKKYDVLKLKMLDVTLKSPKNP